MRKRLDFGCALWGDDEVDYSDGNKYDLSLFFEYLICYKGVTRFYFPNFRRFNKFCWEIITELKAGYPNIKRIWVDKYYGFNLIINNTLEGLNELDFDDIQHVKVENPKNSLEETICVFKSIMDLSLFNVFCFKRRTPIRYKNFSYSKFAYDCCMSIKKIRIKYNVYVPIGLRKYQAN